MVWGLRILLPTRDQRAAIKLKEELPWGHVTICKGVMLLLSRLGDSWRAVGPSLSCLRLSSSSQTVSKDRTPLWPWRQSSDGDAPCNTACQARGFSQIFSPGSCRLGPRPSAQGGAHAPVGGE